MLMIIVIAVAAFVGLILVACLGRCLYNYRKDQSTLGEAATKMAQETAAIVTGDPQEEY
jgi:hypothetical protein